METMPPSEQTIPAANTMPLQQTASLLRHAKRWITIALGGTIVLFGIAAVFLPVIPAIVVIPVGLAILATELVWARHLLHKIKEKAGMTVGMTGKTKESSEDNRR